MILGQVQNGVVVFEVPGILREGTEVAIQPISPRKKKPASTQHTTVRPALARLAGKAKGLPRDAARNLDHYLYGHPKR
jgi:hypothetical protein